MTIVTYFTDTEGQVFQQLTLLGRNQPAIQIAINQTVMSVPDSVNHLKSFGTVLSENILNSIRFDIPPDHCIVFGGDALDATGPEEDRRDRLMAALLANTATHYADYKPKRFLLVADNRTTNKLGLSSQLQTEATPKRDQAIEQKFTNGYNAPHAIEAWKNEGGTTQSYLEAVAYGTIGTIIGAQHPIQLIQDSNNRYLVFVHGAISPLTFCLADSLRNEFCATHQRLNLEVTDLVSLAEFFNHFYCCALSDGKVYRRLKQLINRPNAEANNLGTPFTSSYPEVEMQLFDPTIDAQYKERYYAVMRQASMVFSGHCPLAGGGIQRIPHPDGMFTPIILGDNSKMRLSCHTYDTATNKLQVHTPAHDHANSPRIYSPSTWNAPYLGLISHDLAKKLDANANPNTIARVIYWDKNSDLYTVACTGKSHYNHFINKVRTYPPHELAQYFPDVSITPTETLPAPSAKNTGPDVSISPTETFPATSAKKTGPDVSMSPTETGSAKLLTESQKELRDITKPPHTLLPEVGAASSPISSGLFKTGFKISAAAGVALIIAAGIAAIVLGIAMIAGSHGILTLPALILMQHGIVTCAATLGTAYVSGGLLLGLSLHGLKNPNAKTPHNDFNEPTVKAC